MNGEKELVSRANRWEFYQDRTKEWQWRKYEDDRVVAVSGKGFHLLNDCRSDATQRGYPVLPDRNKRKN